MPASKSFPPRARLPRCQFALQSCRRLTSRHRRQFQILGHEIVGSITLALEVGAVNGMADVNRKFVEAAYQDVEATFAAIDKLAGALSLTEAYEVYVGICASRHVRTAGRVSR